MTPAHFIPWPNWVLLALNIIAELAVIWIAIRKGLWRFLAFLPFFALFSLAADLGGTIMLFTVKANAAGGGWESYAYWTFYWSVQIGASVLVLLLALQIVTVVLPPWKALISLLAIVLFSCMAAVVATSIPIKTLGDLLGVMSMADAIAVLALPIIWVVRSSEWPKGIRAIVAGLVLSMVLQIGCAVGARLLHTMVGVFTLGVPAASLVGMAFFFVGIRRLPKYAAVKKELKKVPPLSFLATVFAHRPLLFALRREY